MSKKFRYIKFIGALFGILLILLIVAYFLIQLPGVQTYVVKQVVHRLENKLETRVDIKSVNIEFFKTVVLEGLYIEDLSQDTLLYLHEVKADIGLFTFFERDLHFNKITLNGGNIQLHRSGTENDFNFQFIADALNKNSGKEKSINKPWNLNIGVIDINQSQLSLYDEQKKTLLTTKLGVFQSKIDKIDWQNQILEIDELALSQSELNYEIIESKTIANENALQNVGQVPGSMLGMPWDLSIMKIISISNQIKFNDNNFPTTTPNQFDKNHIQYSDINMDIDEFVWISENIKARINEFQFKDSKAPFQLQQLGGNFNINNQTTAVTNFKIETSESLVDGNFQLSYSNFSELIDLDSNIQLESNFGSGTISARDLDYLVPDIFNAINIRRGQKIIFSGGISGSLTRLEMDKLKMNIPNQFVFNGSGNIDNINDLNNLRFNLDLNKLTSSTAYLKTLFPKLTIPSVLDQLGNTTIKARIQGNIKNFTARSVEVISESNTRFRGDAIISGLGTNQNMNLVLKVDSFATHMEVWKDYITQNENIANLGRVSFQGTIKNENANFIINGKTTTDIGTLKSDLSINFFDQYTNASYSGNLYLNDFDIKKVVANTEHFGLATVYFIGKGQGLELQSLEANMEAVIEKLNFKGYDYEYVNIEGDFKNRKFEGLAMFEDDNAVFDFAGLINFEDSIPDFDFKIHIDTINFQALNLTEYQLGIKTDAQFNFSGTDITNIEGTILMTDIVLQDSSYAILEDSLKLTSKTFSTTAKSLEFESDFLRANMSGIFDIDLIPVVTQYFINEYFSISMDTILTESQSRRILSQEFSFDINLDDPEPLKYLGISDWQAVKNGHVMGNFIFARKSMNIQGSLNELSYQGMKADTLKINATGSSKRILSDLQLIDFRGSGIQMPNANLGVRLANDSLQLRLDADGSTNNQLIYLHGVGTATDTSYKFQFGSDIILNDTTWNINPKNSIHLYERKLFVDQFSLSRNNNLLSIQSEGAYTSNSNSAINLNFEKFNLVNLIRLTSQDQQGFDGILDGRIQILNPLRHPQYMADITIGDFSVDQDQMGDLSIKASLDSLTDLIKLNVGLQANSKKFSAIGSYNTKLKSFDITGQINSFELKFIEPFTTGIISDVTGQATGNFKLKGTTIKPEFICDLNISDVSTVIDFLNIQMGIPKTVIHIDPRSIDFGQIDIRGIDSQSAILTGSISHDYFKDFNMDMQFRSQNFKLLNTTSDQNDIFWGTLNLDSNVKITGSLKKPKVEVSATTLSDSYFNFQVNSENENITNSDYIFFTNPNGIDTIQGVSIENKIKKSDPLLLDLIFNLEVTPEAELTIILDPISGDKVVGRGTANLVAKMNPKGDIDILGTYYITEGNYQFNYGQLIKKSFALESGSKVFFTGDPLNTQLDIKASYSSNTSPLDLIKNETTLSSQESQSLQKRTEVKTILLLKGNLNKPDISFDIQMPENDDNILNSTISRKLAELRSDQAEMNKQVFSLLLFNSFFPSTTAGNLLLNQSENLALSSVSKLITNQLNALSDKYIKGFEISVDIDSYRSQTPTDEGHKVLSELQIGLSKKLFNDRLTIKADADLNVNSLNTARSSSIVGDFILEYRLSESGNYLLKVFRKSDFDILKDENTARNGIGISLKRSFGQSRKKQ